MVSQVQGSENASRVFRIMASRKKMIVDDAGEILQGKIRGT